MRRWAAIIWMGLCLAASAARGQVSGWRGDGTGIYPGATPPAEWGEKKNVAWTTKAGKSNSSPIVVGQRVLVTAEPNLLICLDRSSGKILWQKSNGFGDLPPELHAAEPKLETSCGYTSPTPLSDGKNVYVALGTGIVASYDLDGQRQWITYLEQEPTTTFGRSASPALAGDKLIVSVSHLVALEANTGKVVWDQKEAAASYGTPVAAEVNKRMVIVTPAGDVLDPVNGMVLASKLGTMEYSSPVVREGVAYFIDAAATAIRLSFKPDGKLDKKVLWETDLDGEFFASPVVSDGRIYTCNTVAQYYVLDAAKGTTLLSKTLELPPAGQSQGDEGPQVYPSLTMAGRRLLVSNTVGDTFVLEPGGEYKEVKRNEVGGQTLATPVCAGKQIFLRRGTNLICVGE